MQIFNTGFLPAVAPYRSDWAYPVVVGKRSTGSMSVNTDYLTPFFVREAVTIDAVWWYRFPTDAANVYVGIYSAAGALLTNCAVDTNTTAGYHQVSTSAVTLQPNTLYFMAINCNFANVGYMVTPYNVSEELYDGIADNVAQVGIPLIMGAAPIMGQIGLSKARANAALLANLVMTGWAAAVPIFGGFVKQ